MKARFKSVLLTAFSTLAAFSTLTFTACNNDKCQAIACASGGVCEEGRCTCTAGYEGNQCETETRLRYLGIWYVTEDGTISTAAQYAISIERGAGPTELRIKNFRNSFTSPVQAFVSSDTLTIPVQVVNKSRVQGRGIISPDNYYGVNGLISIAYSVEDTATKIVDNFGVGNTGNPSKWNK